MQTGDTIILNREMKNKYIEVERRHDTQNVEAMINELDDVGILNKHADPNLNSDRNVNYIHVLVQR